MTISYGDRTQIREVMSGGSYYSHNDLRLHFGLGSAHQVDAIEVAWPSGIKDRLTQVQANQILQIEEGKSMADSSPAAPPSVPVNRPRS